MTGDRNQWKGTLKGRRGNEAGITLKAPLQASKGGGSGAFLASGDDANDYYVKVINNGQSPRVPISEQIVGRAAQLIGAPVPQVTTIRIAAEFVGWEFKPRDANREYKLEMGIAHAIREVSGCSEIRSMGYRSDDDNVRRHAFVYAIYDWCSGSDPQWLLAGNEQNAYYSHDHGHYFPNGPSWSADKLERHISDVNPFPGSTDGIPKETWTEVAEHVAAVTKGQILDVLSQIPTSWPVTDAELETMGFFLASRAISTSDRLKTL